MLSKFHEKQNEEGFTLIELLVVIIIIGILAAIAIPTFLGQRERARRGAVQSDLRNMAINAETYFTDEQSYGDFTQGNDWLTFTPSTDVVLVGYESGTAGFCIEAYHLDGAAGDVIATSTDQLPADDGGYWIYDSTNNPQLVDASDYGTGGQSCVDDVNANMSLGGGAGVNHADDATLDGRQ